jgi:transposase
VESTGGYENNWIKYLQQVGTTKAVQVARINPKAVKSLGEAALTRTITDSVSAENIALYLIDFHHKIHYLQPSQTTKTYNDGRKHNSFIRMLKKQKNQIGNQLEKVIYQELSVLMCYCRHGFPGWLLLLLEKYPGVGLIQKAGVKKLSNIKGISNEKAIAIIKKISSLNDTTSAHSSSIIKSTVRQMLHLEQSIKAEKVDLLDRFKSQADVILLTSITGVAEQSAVEVLIEIEDINRFETAKQLLAYFGTHPMWKQSGDGTWGNHMSKKGRSEIRAVLYMACMTAIRHDQMFKGKYAAARAQGKNHFSAMGVVMNKMLRIIFGVLKNKTSYNIETDQKNQQNAKAKQKEKEKKQADGKEQIQTKLERYNDATLENLPISNRHAKKKRQSPKLQIEECTGSPAS